MIYRASLFGLPGFTTVGAAVFDSSYVPAVTDTDIDLLTGEISTGDASGYARITNIATTWNAGTFRLDIDDPGTDTFDLYGAPDVATLVFYDPSDGALISWVPITPHVGFDGWPIPVASVADIADTGTLGVQVANLDGRVTVLENDPGGGGGGVPDPSGEDDGDVLTVSSGAAVWAPPPGGGGAPEWGDIGGTLADQADLSGALDAKADDADLSPVAKTGDYGDLTGTPTIPSTPGEVGAIAVAAGVTVIDAGDDLATARPAGIGVAYWLFDDDGVDVGAAGENIANGVPGDLWFVPDA